MKMILFICLMLAGMGAQGQSWSVDKTVVKAKPNTTITTAIGILINVPANRTVRDVVALNGCVTKGQWKALVKYWREEDFGTANKIEVEIDSAKIKKVLTFEQAENFIVCR